MSFIDRGFLFQSSSLKSPPQALTSRSVSSDQQQQQEQKPAYKTSYDSKSNPLMSKDDSKKVSEQLCCGICLDIMVYPQTIVPCGHTYCGSCLADIEKSHCPECRSAMTSLVPALQLKSLIETMVIMPGVFPQSDSEHYQERKKTEQCRGFQVRSLRGKRT